MYREKNYLPVHFVETTRGCPIDCEFCAVSTAFGGNYRNRPIEEVLAELQGLKPFDGFLTLKNCVFFVDDNIISNRAYAREFFTRIADFKLHWFGQASMNIARDPEILRLCQQSGCVGLFIGFETLSPETLASVGKRVNRPDEYFEVVKRIHDHGIGIDGSFVFGFDTDDDGVFDRTVEFVLKAKLEVAYFSILTPYPGTRLHRRLEEERRLLTPRLVALRRQPCGLSPQNIHPGQTAGRLSIRAQGGLLPLRHFQAAVGNHLVEEFLLPDEFRLSPEREEAVREWREPRCLNSPESA